MEENEGTKRNRNKKIKDGKERRIKKQEGVRGIRREDRRMKEGRGIVIQDRKRGK